MFEMYLDAHNGKSPHHRDKLKYCRARFKTLGEKVVCDLHLEDFEPTLNKLGPSMRNAELRLLRAVLNYGIKREYLDKNPLNSLDFAEIHRGEVETIPARIVEAMLRDAAANEPTLLPFLVLGFYCGIRPTGELRKMLWSDISLHEKLVTVRYGVSKTKSRRLIPLSDNALAWLKLCQGKPTDKVVRCSHDMLRKKREALWIRAGEGKWINSGMRHTFCSCWLAKHKDVNVLLEQSGHRTPDMLYKHYKRTIEIAEAEKFWSIFPPHHF
jgi:integrase